MNAKKISSKPNSFRRLIRSYKNGHLFTTAKTRLGLLKYLFYDPASKEAISLHCPEYITPDTSDLPLVERIFSSFKKMKLDEINAPKIYLPSSLWREQLEHAYS